MFSISKTLRDSFCHWRTVLRCSSLLFLICFPVPVPSSPHPNPSPTPARHRSPWEDGLRPASTLDLPVLDILEPPGKKFDPGMQDMQPQVLKAKLGRSYEPRFMSIKKPTELNDKPNGTVEFPFKRNQRGRLVPLGTLPNSIRRLDLKHLTLPDGTHLRTRISRKLRRKLHQFLWAYTSCPVLWRWKDLGVRFWPRWLRTGHCATHHSCSIPPGMGCRPSKSEHKVLLRWYCPEWDPARGCRWISVRYPVITECSCSCSSRHQNSDEDDS